MNNNHMITLYGSIENVELGYKAVLHNIPHEAVIRSSVKESMEDIENYLKTQNINGKIYFLTESIFKVCTEDIMAVLEYIKSHSPEVLEETGEITDGYPQFTEQDVDDFLKKYLNLTLD